MLQDQGHAGRGPNVRLNDWLGRPGQSAREDHFCVAHRIEIRNVATLRVPALDVKGSRPRQRRLVTRLDDHHPGASLSCLMLTGLKKRGNLGGSVRQPHRVRQTKKADGGKCAPTPSAKTNVQRRWWKLSANPIGGWWRQSAPTVREAREWSQLKRQRSAFA
jgi:hypothetical protein